MRLKKLKNFSANQLEFYIIQIEELVDELKKDKKLIQDPTLKTNVEMVEMFKNLTNFSESIYEEAKRQHIKNKKMHDKDKIKYPSDKNITKILNTMEE